jgi:hypothetical protein
MNKEIFQRVAFIISALCAFLNPILDMLPWFRYTMLAASLFYIGLGWYFTMIRDGGHPLASELAGYIHSTVFIASFMMVWDMPLGKEMTYYGYLLSFALMIYMIINRKTVRRDMLIQSIALWLLAPLPLFV